ncbi:vanin-like protein 2 [Topomyia yanbarensis]|uniref:vanin-like protein 2 n=1 Tax=Topomyia yanbarensis TaxID=2498891 RepID=UPI00273C7BAB|nr:vanin-like protein 2 [Topomyia yanbarensis]XP_058838295.1 vanin-like protein 2 [Topomyia yanbarensis]XP_058838296.1 vanin-like protein 2 [Topomyia yanbarensis]XP_058838297.1 vanin-like protein 2 [Topomyia yanbarensis]XP_058838298.1 vanin-like protein 2 [Topomyia yanbarensis]XP_058838299.1 vanin-like protein 2 [Topomyia yanbarensis]XP_058838300.1 vanin-like protein 2 [Topomyia yanbarensis]XP_058838301.1 vanin-like protein 2 [Topomyia yanbarensis]
MNGIAYLYGALLFLLSQTELSRQFYNSNFVEDTSEKDGSSSGPQDDSYVVGVVEFRPELLNMDIRQRTELHLDAYEQLIRSDEAKLADLIVFPELTLNTLSDPVYVPDSHDNLIPCRTDSPELLSRMSCLAAEVGKYIVINLSEIFDCEPEEDPRPCGPHGFHRYNTDVVFDRNGAVIARYRKFNLFREAGTNTTHLPEIVTFETDFGVTFGVFTCFDLLFAQPALELIKRDVKDFIFPAMWTSEPPFLTATQIFESWAHTNNVNLIASGTNYDPAGSTGTGVFNGRNGAVFSFMTGAPTRTLFPVRVPKIHSNLGPNLIPKVDSGTVSGRLHGKLLENIRMGRDFLEAFTTMQINPEQYHDQIGQIICNGEFCCDFSVTLTVIPDRDITHYYRFAVYDGVRTFQGYADAHVSTCGIITCRNTSLDSCGLPMNENSNYLEFNEIFISGKFIANGTLVMPNSLDDMFHSLDADRYQFYSSVNYSTNTQNVQLTLSSTVANLQTFAIYAFNHKNFEFFAPVEPPPVENTTDSPITDTDTSGEDDEGGSSLTAPLSNTLILLLLVSSVVLL